VTFADGDSSPPAMDVIRVDRVLRDWRGEAVGQLRIDSPSAPLALLARGNREEAYLLYLFGMLTISIAIFSVSRWIVNPMQRLRESMETAQIAPIENLLRAPDEFGEFARQVSHSFVQRDALRRSEESLRHSIALRARLARDLHDGIIQSLYAAGLGLESARTLRATDPDGADKRLASSQKMLNDALWQVRNFINALEPEQEHTQSAAQSIATLASSMQALQPVPIEIDIDHELTAKIGATQEIQLLQIARELLSNAVRHANARQVRISLRAQADGHLRLEVSDDGVGFNPATLTSSGRGLSNLAARAREIDGQLEIDSSVGKGARIAIWFRPVT
jgi:signal transduction histidine kinase